MHFHGLVGKEVVGKIIFKHRGFALKTMWGSSLADKKQTAPPVEIKIKRKEKVWEKNEYFQNFSCSRSWYQPLAQEYWGAFPCL